VLLIMSDSEDEFFNSKNKFVRFCVFLYKIIDVPVTTLRGNLILNLKAGSVLVLFVSE